MNKTLLEEAYNPDQFRDMGYQLIDELSTYLGECLKGGGEWPANSWRTPADAFLRWQIPVQEQGGKDTAMAVLRATLQEGVHLHHPKYMGHQISPPLPVTALAGLLSDWMNNGMGVYEMGIPGTTMERVVIQKVAQQMGYGPAADGYFTSGGTLANLTALLAARSLKAKGNTWQEGHQGSLALVVSEDAHYCVDRAVRIMGWGEKGIIKVPVNEQFQMKTELLEPLLMEAQAKGLEVIAVVGSACSTATGSFDNLEAIGDFCARHQLWFHVDGAHGAALVFSEKYKQVVKGIDRADSVAMDFHKMLLTPSVTTALIFKNGQDSYQTFSQKADYLFEKAEAEWFNLAKRTFECTKLMLGLKAYITLAAYGTGVWEEGVTKMVDLGKTLAALIAQRPDIELATPPACNIVCFRYHPATRVNFDLNLLNDQIRQAILEDGAYYIVKTLLKGTLWLRTTLANPFTTEKELNGLLDKIEDLGSSLSV
ncbi:MAG: pyridoxal-dependent decarboxylase [Saprospiraceae bacterium]